MSIRDVLMDNNVWWFGEFFKKYRFKRVEYYELRSLVKAEKSFITLLIGMRRTGKTVILKQLVSNMCESFGNNAIYVPVDELILRGFNNPILESVEWFLKNIYNGKEPIIIALDEVQYYENWALEAKVLYDKFLGKKKVFIISSGSSSLGIILGAGEGLIGRSKIIRLYPMGLLEIIGLLEDKKELSEYASMNRISLYNKLVEGKGVEDYLDELATKFGVRSSDMDRAFETLITFGSLPQTIEMIRGGHSSYEIREMLLEMLDLTIMRDVLRLLRFYPSKYELEPIEVQSIFNTIAYNSPYLASVNSIAEKLGISWRKADLAIKLGELAGIIGIANNFSKSPMVRKRKKPKKFFITDIGIRNAVRYRLDPRKITDEEKGRILENILLIQIQKIVNKLGDPNPKIYFWRMNNKGVDGVIVLKDKFVGLEVKKSKRKTQLKSFKKYIGENVYTHLIEEKTIKNWLLL